MNGLNGIKNTICLLGMVLTLPPPRIPIEWIPKDTLGNAYEHLKRELELGNEIVRIQDQSGSPSEWIIICDLKFPFRDPEHIARVEISFWPNQYILSCRDPKGGATIISAPFPDGEVDGIDKV